MINFLGNIPNHPSKFRAENWVEVNDKRRGMYNANNEINFTTLNIKTSLCDSTDAYTYTSLFAWAKWVIHKQLMFITFM